MNNNTQNGALITDQEHNTNRQIEGQLFHLLADWNFDDLVKTLENQEDEFRRLREEVKNKDNQLAETEKKLEEEQNKLKQLTQKLEKQGEKITCLQEEVRDKDNQLAETKDKLEEKQRNLEKLTQKLERQENKINDLQNELKEKELKLTQLAKELGEKISELKQENITLLAQQGEILEEQWKKFYSDIEQRWQDFNMELVAKREQVERELAVERENLEKENKRLGESRKSFRLDQRKIETERELLEEDKQALEKKIEQKVTAEVQLIKSQIEFYKDQLTAARKIEEAYRKELTKIKEANRIFGTKTPDEIYEKLQMLRSEKEQLEQQLAARPSENQALRLQELEKQQEEWEAERYKLSTELQELKRKITYHRIAVTELETMRDEKDALESSNNRLRKALDELTTQVNQAFAESKNNSAFPECFRMDENSKLQSQVTLHENIPNLQDFVKDLRYRIAQSPLDKSKILYYSERDIKLFLGGLAMSRLHLLQGISGTGKTSLAVAFARAVQGQYKLIEVQAGWRDRQDLLGYFNAFEGRFYESHFLQSLYEAQCPFYRDRIYIIVLDEMNLSRPEQYFADFLSKLEQENPTLALTTDLKRPSPDLFEEGRILKIPSNIWFIGTANQDETTLEFADKTYDRAHVMELQRHHEQFEIPEVQSRPPIAYEALQQAFQNAQKHYVSEAQKAYDFLNIYLADQLENKFKIGWGNRLERQLKAFIPVVIAGGGTLGEATDHILATKILRKIRDRYDTPVSDLKQLKTDLETAWSEIDQDTKAKESLAILDKEIHRLEPES